MADQYYEGVEEEERRYAPDGGYYTFQEFYNFYGREDEWHQAAPGDYNSAAQESQQRYQVDVEEEGSSGSEDESSGGSDVDSEEEERQREAEMMKKRLARLRLGPWELEVSILRGKDLFEVGNGKTTRSQTNPFVSIFLNKMRIGKTKTLRKTTEPEWNFDTGQIYATGPAWLRKSDGQLVSRNELEAEERRRDDLLLIERKVKEEKEIALKTGKVWEEMTSEALSRASANEHNDESKSTLDMSENKVADPDDNRQGVTWQNSELRFEVFDWDRLAAHRFLGQVVIPGSRLASLVKGIKRMIRRKPKKVKPEGEDNNEIEGKSNQQSGSDRSSSSEESSSSSESESESDDSNESDSSSESDGSGRSSMSSEPRKPKYLTFVEHTFEEDFQLTERPEDKTASKHGLGKHEEGSEPSKSDATESQREKRLRRLRAIQKAASTIIVQGTLTVRVSLRSINVSDSKLISRGQRFMEKKKATKLAKKIRKKLRKGKSIENLIKIKLDSAIMPKKNEVNTKRDEEDSDLKLTPLEELYVSIDRFHVGSITRSELLRALTQDKNVQTLLSSHHFEQMGFQLLGRPRLFAEAFLIMDYNRTGEIDFRSFSLFAAHMQATDAPNRLLLRMVYDVILADIVEKMKEKVRMGEASRAMLSGQSWLTKRDIRDGLTRNRRAVRLLQRAKTMQVLAFDRIFGESLMRLNTQRAGYLNFEEFVLWARSIEREREERIALAKIFDAILKVDQLESAGSAEEVKRSIDEEDLVEPDTLIDKKRLVHSMERMTLPRYSEVYELVSTRFKHLFRPLLRPALYMDALRALPTKRGGEVHFEEFAKFVIQYCRFDYRSRMVLWNVFDELLPAGMDSATGSLSKAARRGETYRDMVKRLFQYIDVNNDGQLSKTELLTAVTRRRKREPELDAIILKLSQVFPKLKMLGKPGSITSALLEMDTDKDGEVSVNELLSFCQQDIKTASRISKTSIISALHGGRARITEYLAVQGTPKKKQRRKKSKRKKSKKKSKSRDRQKDESGITELDSESGLFSYSDTPEGSIGYSILLTPRLWQENLLRLQTTKRNQLTFEEFVAFCNDMRSSAKYRVVLRKVFDAIDIEGTGRIKSPELVKRLDQSDIRQTVQAEMDRDMTEIYESQKREQESKFGRKVKRDNSQKTVAKFSEGKTEESGMPHAEARGNSKTDTVEENLEKIPEVPSYHPLQILMKKEFYYTPISNIKPYCQENKGDPTKEIGIDFEDFVNAVIPLCKSIKERLAVMDVFNSMNVVSVEPDKQIEGKSSQKFIPYDETQTISVNNKQLLSQLQNKLLALDEHARRNSYVSTDGGIKYFQQAVHLQEREQFRGRSILDEALCSQTLKQLKVKHVNSRKHERYATLEELVNFLLRMRKEHRDRDAIRDVYEALRFAKGMPLENSSAPMPSFSEIEALLCDASKEYITDEAQRRPHRRPSRPVDALMILMNKTREALKVPTDDRKWENSHKEIDIQGDSNSPNRLDLETLIETYKIGEAVNSGDLSGEFFEQCRFATAEVIARLDNLNILQRPLLYKEYLNSCQPSSYEEFYQFVIHVQRTMKTRAVLRRIFDLIDTDMSNDLSKQELLFAFTRSREVRLTLHQLEGLKTMQDPHLFEAAFEAIDVDNDGSVSYEELVQFALKSGDDGNLVVEDNEDTNEWEASEDEEKIVKYNGETVDDKWDELRRKEGALPDHDPMYRPMDYSNDDENETTGVIYEEMHELYEIFDKMVSFCLNSCPLHGAYAFLA